MTDPASLANELERLADIAFTAIEANLPPSVQERWTEDTWATVHAITERLVEAGFAQRHAEQAVTAWILLRRKGGGRLTVLDCVGRTDENGPKQWPEPETKEAT